MNVQLLIVRMVLGLKLEDRFGPRGGYLGCFLGSQKISARTFGAAKRQGLIVRGERPDPSAPTFFPRIVSYKLTREAALAAEKALAFLPDREYADSRTEHQFKYLVPGVVIYYGSRIDNDPQKWLAHHPVTEQVIAEGWELRDCAEAAEARMVGGGL